MDCEFGKVVCDHVAEVFGIIFVWENKIFKENINDWIRFGILPCYLPF